MNHETFFFSYPEEWTKEVEDCCGMAGGKELPEYLSYNQRGIYTGIRDVYLTYGGDEVKLEIGEGMYHAYSAMPLIPEAKPANERMIRYLKV